MALKALGVPVEDMRVVALRDLNLGVGHAVLIVYDGRMRCCSTTRSRPWCPPTRQALPADLFDQRNRLVAASALRRGAEKLGVYKGRIGRGFTTRRRFGEALKPHRILWDDERMTEQAQKARWRRIKLGIRG